MARRRVPVVGLAVVLLVAAGRPSQLRARSDTANTWSSAGSMLTSRAYHAATLLPSGKVLVAGGLGGGSAPQRAVLY
ncbi:MAG: hypothetical protein ACYDCQ_05500, partial [Dehalococcoidia bacterium]